MPRSHLDAFDEAPLVTACDGEVVISGSLVSAAYTVEAARVLMARLEAALAEAERQTPVLRPQRKTPGHR